MGIKIEMADLANLNRFWAWSNKTYNSVGDFAIEYNAQAKRFGEEHLCKEKIAALEIGAEVPTQKWVFRVVGK